MTIAEFNSMGWTPGMKASYRGKVYDVATVDFDEQLVGLILHPESDPDLAVMVRCENVTLVDKPSAKPAE